MAAHWFSLNVLQATHCAVGLNPRVARWYQAIYAFDTLGEAKPHNHLQAPKRRPGRQPASEDR